MARPDLRLIAAAQAVIDRWDSPLWKDAVPTAELIHVLRNAVRDAVAAQPPTTDI